jgi:VWFA-related protein
MRSQATTFLTAILLWSAFAGRAQEVSHTATPTVIRSETRLVLVDSVVTDKKGNYVPDLTQKDFKVFEDNKEQSITSFTYEADPASPNNNQKHYLVLFFDNASVGMGDQMQARAAAQKFVDNNTGPNKFIAVVNFSGTLRITQNFTNDPDQLRAVISGAKSSTVNTSDAGTPGLSNSGAATLSAAASFGINSVLLGLRGLAKGLIDVPGRKMIVMLTAGFPMNDPEVRSELTATIDACNKSNVSIYPIDVRGLVAPSPGGMQPGRGIGHQNPLPLALFGFPAGPSLASFGNSFQSRGGAGAGSGAGSGAGVGAGAGAGSSGGSRGGGSGSTGTGSSGTSSGGSRGGAGTSPGTSSGTSAGRGGGGNTNVNPGLTNRNNPLSNPRSILPPVMAGADANQSALYMLAEGTGGFVIVNTNDLLGGMEKIAREQNQYYIIGFSPAESPEGSCHTLHVKVGKGGDNVRSRSGYCNVRQVDLLAGKPAETELEAIAAGVSKGNLGAPLQVPFFYASPNVARVNVAMEIPSASFKFDKVKGKLHSEINVLGIAYRPDGSVGAKFSDTVKYDFDNKVQVEDFARRPVHYESQFDVATGQYNFKVVFSGGGENFGKLEKPLVIEPFDGKQFAVSALALGELRKSETDLGADAALIEDRVPLVALGVQDVPAAEYKFKATDPAGAYLEIFEPGLTGEKPPEVLVSIVITDRKSGVQKASSGNFKVQNYIRPGNPLIPIILKLPVKDLPVGSYRLDINSQDTAGKSQARTADFEIEAATAPAVGWDKN